MIICIEARTSTRIDKVFKAKMLDTMITPKVCNSKKSDIETPLHICTYTELERREGSLWLSLQIVIEKVKNENVFHLSLPLQFFKAIKMLITPSTSMLIFNKTNPAYRNIFSKPRKKIKADKIWNDKLLQNIKFIAAIKNHKETGRCN